MSSNGTVAVDKHRYYIGRRFKGRQVVLQLDAANQQFQVTLPGEPGKQLAIKGLYQGELELGAYIEMMLVAARSEWQRLLRRRRLRQPTRRAG